MSGTSMATPHVAGSAALVTQYYQEGYATCGSKCVEHGVTPSAALLKATLVSTIHPNNLNRLPRDDPDNPDNPANP